MTEALQPGAASQDFMKQLASVTLPTEWSLKEKEKETLTEAADQTSQIQTSDQVKTLVFVFVFKIITMIVLSFFVFNDQFW